MADTPFGPYSGRRSGAAGRHGDGQGSRARERGAQRSRTRTWERSFRCASARRRPIENSMARYIDFVRIHQEATAESAVAVRRIWWVGVAFAVIAAGLAYAIVLALRGLLDVPVPVFARSEVSTQAAALSYAVCAMAGSIHQNNDTQRWVLLPSKDGSFTVQQLSSGRFVDAHDSASNDFRVVTRGAANADRQRWFFDRV